MIKPSALTKQSLHKKLLIVSYPLIIILCAACVIFVAASGSRKNDYVITDGSDILKVSSYSQSAESVLEEFEIDIENATYEVIDCDGYTEISITRSFPVTIICDGKTTTVTVEGGNVVSLLNDLCITLQPYDTLSCALSDKLYRDMEIKVSRVEVEYTSDETTIPCEVTYVDSPYLKEGTTKVFSEGSDGVLQTTYKSTYVDGVLDSFSIEGQEVVSEPVTEIVANGTKTSSKAKSMAYSTSVSTSDSVDNSASEADDGTVTTLSGETLSYSKVINMTATAYTYNSGANITSSGAPAQVGIVAALPGTLPQGTRVYIVSAYGTWEYGVAIVGDKPARNIVDLFMETYDECINFGVKDALVYVLD